MFNSSEQNAVLLYRKDASEPWRFCPASDPTPGSLTNGSGYVLVDTLLLGQYAFGKGDISLAISHIPSEDAVKVFPNPASDLLFLDLPSSTRELTLEITDLSGKVIQSARFDAMRSDRVSIDVSNLPTGIYNLKWCDKTWFSKRFSVIH